jgi:GntR family transcriptional regulator
MNFDIFPNAPTPIYRQIVEQVRRLVASGQLKPGEPLPSVRAVALNHAINPMTVSKAYSLLESEGMLMRLRGVGMTVAPTGAASTLPDKMAMLRPALAGAANMVRQLGLADAEALALFQACLNDTPTKEQDEHH